MAMGDKKAPNKGARWVKEKYGSVALSNFCQKLALISLNNF